LRSDNWSELRNADFPHAPNTKRKDAKKAHRRRLTWRLRSPMSFAGGLAVLLASNRRHGAHTNQGQVEFPSLRCLSDLGILAVCPGWAGSNPESRIPSPESRIPSARSPGDKPLAYRITLGVPIQVFRRSPSAIAVVRGVIENSIFRILVRGLFRCGAPLRLRGS